MCSKLATSSHKTTIHVQLVHTFRSVRYSSSLTVGCRKVLDAVTSKWCALTPGVDL